MSLFKRFNLGAKAVEKTAEIIDKLVTDKDLAQQLKAKVLELELQGSDPQRNWRPHLMYVIMFLLVWLIVIVPLLGAIGLDVQIDEALKSVPPQIWTLLTVGSGGYIAGRSFEKMAKSWKGKNG